MIKQVTTYTATIEVGLLVRKTGKLHSAREAQAICQAYCLDAGLCVTFTQTSYIRRDEVEPGVKIGLINDPQSPIAQEDIHEHALMLANTLMIAMEQERVSVVFPDRTVTLSSGRAPN